MCLFLSFCKGEAYRWRNKSDYWVLWRNDRNGQCINRKIRRLLTASTSGQSCKNICLESSQISADCCTNSQWHPPLAPKRKKASPRHANVKSIQSLRQTLLQDAQRLREQAQCSWRHWGHCRNTEVRGLQTLPSLLCLRGVLCYFHFTNNLRTAVQDAGSGGASLQNRETDTSLNLAGDQVYICDGALTRREKGGKLLGCSESLKWRHCIKYCLSSYFRIVKGLNKLDFGKTVSDTSEKHFCTLQF